MSKSNDVVDARTGPGEGAPAAQGSARETRHALLRSRALHQESIQAVDIAARSVLESHVLDGTVANLVDQRALDHHYRGLLQFAALRVGAEAAADALQDLERHLDDVLADLADAVSVKARLYRRLWLAVQGRTPPAAVALWVPEDAVYRARLEQLRDALAGPVADAAELAFARRLTSAEVAHVLGLPMDRVAALLAEARTLAVKHVGPRPESSDGTPESALAETFSVDFKRTGLDARRVRLPVLEEGATVGERYEIETRIGSGTFADVYRARDRDVPDHVVALKILRHRARDAMAERRALRELQLIASVFHPSVVQLKDHGWVDGRLWFVMPLYRGETLAQRISRGPLSRARAREIFEPLSEALATMHRAGVRHQDVKPENVFLARLSQDTGSDDADEDGPVLPILLDLGVAAKDAELVLAGTPLYFAPEVAARFAGVPDPSLVGPKADVFSLALTLVHALDPAERDGVPPLAVDAFVAMRARKSPLPPRARELRDLAPHIARWLNRSPDARPTAAELRDELRFLTRPAEQHARRMAALRWVLPSFVAVVTLFFAVVYVLRRENQFQRAEAAMARAKAEQAGRQAEDAFASFTQEEARRRALEADVRGLEQDKEQSRMTRDELTVRLRQVEQERDAVAERERLLLTRVQKETELLRDAREQYSALSADHSTLKQQRAEAITEAERQQQKRAAMETELNRGRERLGDAERALEQEQIRAKRLEDRLNALRAPFGIPHAPGADKSEATPKATPEKVLPAVP